jgi:hypothetical protein
MLRQLDAKIGVKEVIKNSPCVEGESVMLSHLRRDWSLK